MGLVIFSQSSFFSAPAQAQSLLSYWNFNNDSGAFSSPFLGSLSTTDGGYGEVYNSSTKTLSSNSANGVVYPSSSINFSGVVGSANTGDTNHSGFGVFRDASINLGAGQTSNLYAGDASTQQGSLIVVEVAGGTPVASNLVFSLDTQGYQGISLSYAGREGGGLPAVTWSYSYDDSNWTSFTPTQTGTLGVSSFNDVSLSLGSLFDNKSAVYLEATITENSLNNTGSFAMDNIQVLAAGTIAVPEPSSFAMGLMGIGLLILVVRRQRSLGSAV